MANGDVVFFGYPIPSRSHAVLVIILIIINSHAKPLPSLLGTRPNRVFLIVSTPTDTKFPQSTC